MNKIKKIVIIFITIVIIGSPILIFFNNGNNNNNNNNNNNILNEINNIQEEIIEDNNNTIEEQQQVKEEPILVPETYTTMYATVGLNIREQPTKESNIVDVVTTNTELTVVDNSNDNDWVKIKIDDNYYYVASQYLSETKVEIKSKVITNRSTNSNNKSNTNARVLTKSKGVNYFNGHRETWYSQKVLPGGGLKIPGRHVDSRGLICDGDGYICVASSDYKKGTIVETSLGTGKVYDSRLPKKHD